MEREEKKKKNGGPWEWAARGERKTEEGAEG